MDSALKKSKFIYDRALQTLGWTTLLGLPLIVLITLWSTHTLRLQKTHTCTSQMTLIQKSITSSFESVRANLSNSLSEAQGEVISALRFKKNLGKWQLEWESWNSALARRLDIRQSQVIKASSDSLVATLKGSNRSLLPIEISGRSLWQISFREIDDTVIVAVFHAAPWLTSLQSIKDCEIQIATSDFWIYPKIADAALFTTYWRNPLENDVENIKLVSSEGNDVELVTLQPHFVIAGHVPHDMSHALKVGQSLLLALILIYALILLLSVPKWLTEVSVVNRVSGTLNHYSQAHFGERPRLFLENHFAPLEHATSHLGEALVDLTEAGPLYRHWVSKGRPSLKPHSITYVCLTVPPLGQLVNDSHLRITIIEKIRSEFLRAVSAHGGVIEATSYEVLTAIWGLTHVSEDDGLNAVRTILAFNKNANAALQEFGVNFGFGIIAHTGPSDFQVIVADKHQDLILISDVTNQALELSRFALQHSQHPVVTETTYPLVATQFKLTQIANNRSGSDLKLFSVRE